MDTYHLWGYTKPTKEQIKFIKDKGFKTLRLQTCPGSHILDEKYTIDPRFIKELKQVVDWALEEGMYVIICGPLDDCMDNEAWVRRFEAKDIHYKNYLVDKEHKKSSEDFIKAFWKQYATAFNNSYDERLIFETLNEPVDRYHEHNFFERLECTTCQNDIKIVNEYNQLIIDTIRASGGNNATRFIMVEGLSGSWKNITNQYFKMPNDKIADRLIPTVHNYPMGCGAINSKKLYTKSLKKAGITEMFDALDNYYFSKHIPIYISEVGHDRSIPILERIANIKDFMEETVKDNRSCTVTMMENADCYYKYDFFGYYDKEKIEWLETEYIDTILNAAQKKDFPLSKEFIEKNAVKIESIIGKNLLEKPEEMKHWDNFVKITPNTNIRTVPETYKIEFVIEKKGSDPTILFEYSDTEWRSYSVFSECKTINGGHKVDKNVHPDKNVVVIEINSELAEKIECSQQLIVGGQNIVIKSLKFIE